MNQYLRYKTNFVAFLVASIIILAHGVALAADNKPPTILKNNQETLSEKPVTSKQTKPHKGALNLQQAELLALNNDPMVKYFNAKANAFADRSIAAGALPDPKLRIGIMNAPIDTFNLAQEPMTQKIIGYQQMFPSASLRKHKSNKIAIMGKVQTKRSTLQKLLVLRNVRRAWLNVYRFKHAIDVIRKSQKLFRELVDITQYKYRAGRGNQQNILQAELEFSLLKDKEIQMDNKKEHALATLEILIGDIGKRKLELDKVSIPYPPEFLLTTEIINQHPLIEIQKMSLQAAKESIEVAKALFYPKWGFNLSYGRRDLEIGGEKVPDFFTAVVTLDLPLFTSGRKDKGLSASKKDYMAARYKIEDQFQKLKHTLHADYSNWVLLNERLVLYKSIILPKSEQNAQASIKAYQSQVIAFNVVMRARLMELKNKLQALHLFVDHAIAQVNLLYTLGEGA